MLDWLKHRSPVNRKAEELYGKVVAAARNPWFYGPGRVADTPEGRFDLVAIHLFLVAERAMSGKTDGEALAQRLIEAFVTDMDDCMREMGVGDLTVPKRVKRAAAVFYERAGVYRAALAAPPPPGANDPLAAILIADGLATQASAAFVSQMAAYVRAAHTSITHVSAEDFAAGIWAFAPVPSMAEVSK